MFHRPPLPQQTPWYFKFILWPEDSGADLLKAGGCCDKGANRKPWSPEMSTSSGNAQSRCGPCYAHTALYGFHICCAQIWPQADYSLPEIIWWLPVDEWRDLKVCHTKPLIGSWTSALCLPLLHSVVTMRTTACGGSCMRSWSHSCRQDSVPGLEVLVLQLER